MEQYGVIVDNVPNGHFRTAFLRRKEINNKVRRMLLELSSEFDDHIAIVTIICRYGSGAIPVLLETKKQGLKCSQNYGLSMSMYANLLFNCIVSSRFSDACIDLVFSTTSRTQTENVDDMMFNFLLKISACDDKHFPDACPSGCRALDELAGVLKERTVAKDSISKCSLVLEHLRSQGIMQKRYSSYPGKVSIAEVFEEANRYAEHHKKPDNFAKPLMIALIITYLFRGCGLKAHISWNMQIPFVNVIVSKKDLESQSNFVEQSFSLNDDITEIELSLAPFDGEKFKVSGIPMSFHEPTTRLHGSNQLENNSLFRAIVNEFNNGDEHRSCVTTSYENQILQMILEENPDQKLSKARLLVDYDPYAFLIIDHIIPCSGSSSGRLRDAATIGEKVIESSIGENYLSQETENCPPKCLVGKLVYLFARKSPAVVKRYYPRGEIPSIDFDCDLYVPVDDYTKLEIVTAKVWQFSDECDQFILEDDVENLISLGGTFDLGKQFVTFDRDEMRFLPYKQDQSE